MHTSKALMLLTVTMASTCSIIDSTYAMDKALVSPSDKINYAIGVEIARNYKKQGLDLNLEMLFKGMKDGVAGGQLLLSEKELRNILISVQSDIRRRQPTSKKSATTSSSKDEEQVR